MSQEKVTETGSFRGALDQARDIRDNEAAAGGRTHHTEIRMQGCERVVSYLWPRVGYLADQRGFPRIGKTQQTDVGQHLELQTQAPLFAFLARCGLPRRAICTGFEMQIAQAALAACCKGDFLAMSAQVEQQFAGVSVVDHSAKGHFQRDIGTRRTVLVGSTPVLTIFRTVQTRVAEIHQGIDVSVGDSIDTATPAAIPAVRAAL